jgi:hypothetical protein
MSKGKMSKGKQLIGSASSRRIPRLCGFGLTLPAILAVAPAAHAFQLYDGSSNGNNWEINLDITASYTGMFRVGHVTPVLASSTLNPSGYQGDANFRHGLVNNLFEVLPVLDIKNGSFGMHFSGEYYVNTVYLTSNQNNQPDPVTGEINTSFNKDTRYVDGNTGRMLDAFVYDSWNFGGQQITLKAGQQTLFWGQSLFSTNGISGGQAAIDTIAADNIVNAEAQQVFLPIGQIVATWQPNQTYTIQGYYQYQWIPYNLAGVGSYFSTSDSTGPGAYELVLAPGYAAQQAKALTPKSQNGQFGISLQAQYGNYDVGLYTLRYDAKTPVNNIYGTYADPYYRLIYPRDIWLYGASMSTTVGATNIAGEVSLRTHNPLVTTGPVQLGSATPSGDANGNPAYPVGDTMTMLMNAIYGSPALRFDPGGITVTGEIEWDKLLRVTADKAGLAPGRSNDSFSFDTMIEPAYFEVLPNLELQFPVSLAYDVAGNSRVWNAVEGGAANHGTGMYSVSVVATYKENWDASLNFVSYFGKASSDPLLPQTAGSPDRSYISLNLQHTF